MSLIKSLIPQEVKLSLRAIKWIAITGLFLGSNVGSYFYGRESYEDDLYGANIEQVQEDAVDNAETIESQITRLQEATDALRKQQTRTESAINENDEANLNPSCATSDDELREFNEALSAASRGLPDSGGK